MAYSLRDTINHSGRGKEFGHITSTVREQYELEVVLISKTLRLAPYRPISKALSSRGFKIYDTVPPVV